jgi:sporulation protein YlmC with PRC-barrel domain
MQTESLAQDDMPTGAGRRRLISAHRVQGAPVFDPTGAKLGHIEDVLLHKESGRVAYAVMSYGGFLGAGERYHPLPWSMLTYNVDKGGYVVPITKFQLDGAPTLGREQVELQDDALWGDEVHRHYGMPGPFI